MFCTWVPGRQEGVSVVNFRSPCHGHPLFSPPVQEALLCELSHGVSRFCGDYSPVCLYNTHFFSDFIPAWVDLTLFNLSDGYSAIVLKQRLLRF